MDIGSATAVSTVSLRQLEGRHVVETIWSQNIDPDDVRDTMCTINTLLDKTSLPLHVIIDIRQNPDFPLWSTIKETMFGPFRHPNMGHWLVIGSNKTAKFIAYILTEVSNRASIVWFDDEASLWQYVSGLD